MNFKLVILTSALILGVLNQPSRNGDAYYLIKQIGNEYKVGFDGKLNAFMKSLDVSLAKALTLPPKYYTSSKLTDQQAKKVIDFCKDLCQVVKLD